MATDDASRVKTPRRRYGWRLKFLLWLDVLLLGLFVLSRLNPAQAKRLGPLCQAAYEMFNPDSVDELSPSGQRLVAGVRALGGQATETGRTPAFMGLFGGTKLIHVGLYRPELGDEDLVHLLQKYGDHIEGLDFGVTKVTDEGLRHLKGMPNLHQLALGNAYLRLPPNAHMPTSPFTDAGLVYLRDLTQLTQLDLSDLPITDAGLATIGNLQNLYTLYLMRINDHELNLNWLTSFPKLVLLRLDDSQVTAKGLSNLVKASQLRFLSLRGVFLTAEDLRALKALRQLREVDITGCGLLDEQVDELRVSRPDLKIQRR